MTPADLTIRAESARTIARRAHERYIEHVRRCRSICSTGGWCSAGEAFCRTADVAGEQASARMDEARRARRRALVGV